MKARALERPLTERETVTPEGIPLHIRIASAGDRAAAYAFDLLLLFAALFAIIYVVRIVFLHGFGDWSLAAGMLLFFLIRTFYFIWFEARGQGRTPGKRIVHIRVMDAAGGPLRTDAIVVRNLMRELELWVPLMFLVASDQVWPDAPGWARLLFAVWAFVFVLMPLFNRDRLRVGDMVAGTIVVVQPETVLLPDLGGREVERRATKRQAPRYAFTDKQLDIYGIYELQVLEDVLRGQGPAQREAYDAVSEQIRKKIRWKGDTEIRSERFLREFYTALRARLEQKMLLGKRKKDKFSD